MSHARVIEFGVAVARPVNRIVRKSTGSMNQSDARATSGSSCWMARMLEIGSPPLGEGAPPVRRIHVATRVG